MRKGSLDSSNCEAHNPLFDRDESAPQSSTEFAVFAQGKKERKKLKMAPNIWCRSNFELF